MEIVSATSAKRTKTKRRPRTIRAATLARHKRFVAEYVIDHNGARAARATGYSKRTANVTASQFLARDDVQKLVVEAEAEILKTAKMTAEGILEEIRRQVYRDPRQLVHKDGTPKKPRELTAEEAAWLDHVKVSPEGDVTYVLRPRHRYIEMAAKHFGLLTERREIADHQKVIDILNSTLAREKKNAPRIAAAKARRAERMKFTS